MSENPPKCETSMHYSRNVEDTQHVANPIVIIKNDHQENEDLEPETLDNYRSKAANILNNVNEHIEDAMEIPKKDLSGSSVSIGAYLRSEFIGLSSQDISYVHKPDKLPTYKDINIVGHSKKIRKKKPYRHGTVTVQFMGSEIAPAAKAAMQYDPDSNDTTIAGIFVMLMLFHFITFTYTLIYFLSPLRGSLISTGKYVAISCFCGVVILVIIGACFQACRRQFCNTCLNFWVLLLMSTFYGGVSGYLGKRTLIFNTLALTYKDIAFIIIARHTRFDFTSSKMYTYSLVLGGVGLFLAIVPLQESFPKAFDYWEDPTLPKETSASYMFCILFTMLCIAVEVAQLQLFLKGQSVEIGVTDFTFGAYLIYVSLIDYPIRILRKYGFLDMCDPSTR